MQADSFQVFPTWLSATRASWVAGLVGVEDDLGRAPQGTLKPAAGGLGHLDAELPLRIFRQLHRRGLVLVMVACLVLGARRPLAARAPCVFTPGMKPGHPHVRGGSPAPKSRNQRQDADEADSSPAYHYSARNNCLAPVAFPFSCLGS